MEDDAFAGDPWPHFAAARSRHPWLAASDQGYVVNDYHAAKDLLTMGDRFEEAGASVVELMGAQGTPWGRFQVENIMARDGASHSRLRRAVQSVFTPQHADRFRPLMRVVIARLLEEWTPGGAFDFQEFAAQFPITVMCSIIGAPADELPSLQASLEAFGMSFCLDPDFLPELEDAMAVLDGFVQRLVAGRRAGVRLGDEADMLDALLATTQRGEITDRELYDLLIFLFAAGYDTSKNVLTLLMHTLLERPEVYGNCAESLPYCKQVIEEMVRFAAVSTLFRRTVVAFDYRGVHIPSGTRFVIPVSTLGRDPGAFADGDAFLPDRAHPNRHIGFGHGMHICLGQWIARAQLEEALHLVAQRIRNPRQIGAVRHRGFIGVWGLRDLPIAFEPAIAGQPVTSGAA
jgi:cytochrome P450